MLPASKPSLPASAGGTGPCLEAVCSPSACAPSFYLHSQQPGVTQPASSLPSSRVSAQHLPGRRLVGNLGPLPSAIPDQTALSNACCTAGINYITCLKAPAYPIFISFAQAPEQLPTHLIQFYEVPRDRR